MCDLKECSSCHIKKTNQKFKRNDKIYKTCNACSARKIRYYKQKIAKQEIEKRRKEYYKKNKEKIEKRRKEYYKKNKEKLAKRNKEYRELNKKKIKELTTREEQLLAVHSKIHSKKHMKSMRINLMMGKTYKEAYKISMEKYGN